MKSIKPVMFAVLAGLPLMALPAMAQSADSTTTTTRNGTVYSQSTSSLPQASTAPQPVPSNQDSVSGQQGADQSIGNNGGAGSK
jgi:hypothetical protein